MSAADLREVVDLQLFLVSCDGLDLFRRLSLLLQLLHGGIVQLGIDLFCQLLRDGLGRHGGRHDGAAPQDGVGGLLHHVLHKIRKHVSCCLLYRRKHEVSVWFNT